MTIGSDGLDVRRHKVNPNVDYVHRHCHFNPFPDRTQVPKRITSRGSFGQLNTAAPHRHYIQEFRDVATALRARMSLADYKKNYE